MKFGIKTNIAQASIFYLRRKVKFGLLLAKTKVFLKSQKKLNSDVENVSNFHVEKEKKSPSLESHISADI
jgi:hypothetical protein